MKSNSFPASQGNSRFINVKFLFHVLHPPTLVSIQRQTNPSTTSQSIHLTSIPIPFSLLPRVNPSDLLSFFRPVGFVTRRSHRPHGLRRKSMASRLLRLWVRIPLGEWMSVCCECCVLPGRDLCDALITRPEESYRM